MVLAVALSAAAVAVLAWLRGQLLAQEQAVLLNAARTFERTGALGQPEDRALRFADVEALALSMEEGGLVREVLVAKQAPGGRELLVDPFHLELTDPRWRERVEGWRQAPVVSGGDLAGVLYFDIDGSPRRAVDLTTGFFLLLLLGFLVLLVARQRGKERQLGATILELEERRAEIIRLERLALAGQLSANLLHDLRKPVLNIRHDVADLVEAGGQPDGDLLEAIQEQTELFLRLLRDTGFEGFVRSEGEEEEYCDVADVLGRSIALVSYERHNVAVEVAAAGEGLPLVLARPHRLVQLFSNLLLNAFQALGGEGRVWIGVERAPGGLVVSVEDDGPGIAPEAAARVFEPFFTSKGESGGSGLGLYICQRIAGELGGQIRLAPPRRASGARFEVFLPAKSGKA